MNLFQRLFGSPRPGKTQAPAAPAKPPTVPPSGPAKDVTARYYETMNALQKAMSRQDYEAAAAAVRASLKLIPGWAQAWLYDYGRFDISSIPAMEQGGTALALVGDEAGLTEMAAVVSRIPDLEPWAERVEQSLKDLHALRAIMDAVVANPGCLQSDLKTLVGENDGSRVGLLAGYLEKAGKLARVKTGKTYKLVLPGSPEFPVPAPMREVASHRRDRGRPALREIDITKLEYVPLPRSPLKWEEAQAGRERAKQAELSEPFEVRGAGWQMMAVAKIPPAERPDTAFRMTEPCASGLLVIDDLGNAEGFGAHPASALRYDRDGQVAVKAPLLHDIYRLGVHPLGNGMIAVSRASVLHAYDDELRLSIETPLADAPEIVAIRKRFDISDDELKNHIRCVALSRDARRYLFTAVDEAWCVTSDGTGLWGAKLPIKDGWTRVATPSSNFGTGGDVERALDLMNLKLPITPDDVKGRYRTLAKTWHPDLNRSDPRAGEKMAALNAAAEVLTGIDASTLPQYAGARFSQELHRSTVQAGGRTITLTMGIQVGEKFASDWIYAAAFAANSDAVYLAGYSGRVVQVDKDGVGVRVYDIGAVPRQIVDTGDYLYLLTSTRLYVLRDSALHALIDTFDGGELIVVQNGFGLLEKKRLRWFHADGAVAGEVLTKDPIRRVYFANRHLTVETRQQRATIQGAPDWWPGQTGDAA